MSYGTLITTLTAGAGGQASFDFTSIPQTYTDVVVVMSARSDRASGVEAVKLTFNGNTTGYSDKQLLGFGTGAAYTESGANAYINSYGADGNTSTANTFGNSSFYIPSYTAAINKSVLIEQAFETNATGGWVGAAAGLWSNTAAINRITVAPVYGTVWLQNSTASLYGINPIVTGTGTTPSIDYLVVAGGGGGGSRGGGGAGGGGLLNATSFTVASGTPLTVTVGAGGAGSTNGATNQPGTAGSASVFSSISTSGGGYGAGEGGVGGNGGSGGGGGAGGASTLAGGTGVAGQGYAGGASNSSSNSGGGGGGAAAVGSPGASNNGGTGGAGALNTYNGFTQYYAGGGGGGTQGSAGGSGGIGGGGAGGLTTASAGSAGQINTGGGGGGGGAAAGTGYSGGTGGSGVVIIRYLQTYAAASSTTGNPVISYNNGYRIYTFNGSGTITF